MRRALPFALAALTLALPGASQSPGARLHRFIPGDLDLGELPAGVLAQPESPEDFRRAASGTGFDERHTPTGDTLHPRNNWSSAAREMDADTRSPPGTTLRYHEVFTPSVAPFKRTHAYDMVDGQGRLAVRDPSLRPLRVGEIPALWAHDRPARFTGDVMVELAANAPTPIPSVAGEQAVVSFRTEPEVPVAFSQDSAGNLFVRAEVTRTVRLQYVLAAPQRAFSVPAEALPHVPPGGTSFHGPVPAPAVPDFLTRASSRVLAHVGVRPSDPFPRTLDTLVGYFRNFRDAELPPSSDTNLYTRLAMGEVGACRHRAYAFALTLHALGVPARYVGNEAHAWAEVWVPGSGWTRIDLGGWDVNFRNESESRENFLPDTPDPFPRPPHYANGYSTATAAGPRDPRGQGRNPAPGAPEPQPQSPPSPTPGAAPGTPSEGASESASQPDGTNPAANGAPTAARGGGQGTGTGPGGSGPGGTGPAAAPGERGARVAAASMTGAALAEPAPEEAPERRPTSLRLLAVRSSDAASRRGVVRGTLVVCSGEARDDTGAPVADLPVQLRLAQGHRQIRVIGTTVTDAEGRFEARALLPLDLEAGTYSISAHTDGDSGHERADAE